METEISVVQPQVKECQRPLEPEETTNGFCLDPQEGASLADTLIVTHQH